MKAIILGIKDYLRDRRQSQAVYNLYKFYRRPMYYAESHDNLYPITEWLEGSVWHYIRNRRIGLKLDRGELEKIRRWVHKVNKLHCPHCGEKCVLPPWEDER